jgi:hypothetical protein
VRWALLLAVVVAAGITACAAGAAGRAATIRFGVSGGSTIGYRVSIRPDGKVHITGRLMVGRRKISAARARRLRREIQRAHLVSRTCSGTNPDLGSRFIRLGARSVSVRGECESRFQHVWTDLTKAVHLHVKVQPQNSGSSRS